MSNFALFNQISLMNCCLFRSFIFESRKPLLFIVIACMSVPVYVIITHYGCIMSHTVPNYLASSVTCRLMCGLYVDSTRWGRAATATCSSGHTGTGSKQEDCSGVWASGCSTSTKKWWLGFWTFWNDWERWEAVWARHNWWQGSCSWLDSCAWSI